MLFLKKKMAQEKLSITRIKKGIYMIETVANLIDYISSKMNITNDKFEILDSNGNSARLGMPLTDLMKEYGMEKEVVKEGISRSPNNDSTITQVEDYVTARCNLPDGCFKLNASGNTRFGSIQG